MAVTMPFIRVVAEKVPLVPLQVPVVALPVSIPETEMVPLEHKDCVVG